MSSFRIRKFDPATISMNRIFFVIGKRNSGKTTVIRDLLYRMPRPDFVIAMAPTEDTLNMYRQFLPESCIFDHFNQAALDRAVSVQRELVVQKKTRNMLILLDDCLYQKGVLRSTTMRSIFFNGRHDNIGLICAAQYLMDIDASLRTNVDYLFVMRENVLINRQKLYKYFFGQFKKFEDFDSVMQTCTQDYKSLVLDSTRSAAADPVDGVLWYKADLDVPDFHLCSSAIWKLDRAYGLTRAQVRRAQLKEFEAVKGNSSCESVTLVDQA